MTKHIDAILQTAIHLKSEKDKLVRDSASNCLSGLKTVLGEDAVQKAAAKSRSVVSIKKDQAVRENRPSTTQGKPRKVAEAPFRDFEPEKPSKEPLFHSTSKNQAKIVPTAASRKSVEKTIVAKKPAKEEKTDQQPTQSRKSVPRKPIKQQIMNSAFKESMIEGVGIYVNYVAPEGDEPQRESGRSSNPDNELPDNQDHNQRDTRVSAEQEPQEDQEEVDNPEENEAVDQSNELLNQAYEPHENNTYDAEPEFAEEEAEATENRFQRVDDQSPMSGTCRTHINKSEIEYKPHSMRQLRQPETAYEDQSHYQSDVVSQENMRLQQEYAQHQQIINFQNARIEGLMHQINTLSSNLNIVLSKAACLEQNVFQLTCQSQQPMYGNPGYFGMASPYPQMPMPPSFQPSPYGLLQGQSVMSSFQSPRGYSGGESLSFQMYPGQLRATATSVSMSSPREEIEHVRRQIALKSQEISEWQEKRKEEERKMKEKLARIDYVKRETLQPKIDIEKKKKPASKITGENKIEYADRKALDSEYSFKAGAPSFKKLDHVSKESKQFSSQQDLSKARAPPQQEEISFNNDRYEYFANSNQPSYEPVVKKPTLDQETKARAQQMKIRGAKIMNLTLAKILEESEYRRLLDFLSDRDNLQNIGMIDLANLELLVTKVTDMLSYKAEAYVEYCLPWIWEFLNTPGLVSLNATKDLLYVVKMVLGTDKKRKLYQNHLIVELQQLQKDLEQHAAALKRSHYDPRY